ncbi:sodium/glutamate symporter [Kineobactrum salinum]|uniref:Sodium:glutamate symporter n=1 Tax=Kineobactrum salinum TaxID=2708301 RepID=A0A6C0U024_9GAMM|nr:sodium:glutamate symporter [Kineobactrum salinum]QIB65123.1 sodium:glutamate symporter [Kineobactrum salinum]
MSSPLIHICVLGVLLFLGVVLRTRVRLFKTYFIPASLITGCIGLALGQYGFGILSNEMQETFASLPPALISIVFAPMLMGIQLPKGKDVAGLVAPQLLFGYIGDFLLVSIPLLITGLVIMPVWNVDGIFGSLIEIGFVGGHGTAAGMGEVFADLGWSEGGALALTTATIGLFAGIVCGMVIINIGVRNGHVSALQSTDKIASKTSADIIPKQEQPAGAFVTINKEVVEPLAFHFGLIALAIMVGMVLLYLLERATGLNLPLFPMAMIGGLLVQKLLAGTRYAEAIDRGTLNLIQGLALELLIVSAIATIEVPVVIAYALPLLLISAVSLATLLFHFYYLGPRIFRTQWFEHSIVNFGVLAGVTAVGLMLLRTVDPDMKSDAAKAYAMRAPFISPFVGGGLLTSVLPLLVSSYGAVTTGSAFLMACAALLVIARAAGFWSKPAMQGAMLIV